MPIINWNKRFEISIYEIDIQHRKLIEIINNLYDSQKARDKELILKETLFFLVDYTKLHFKTEEEHMTANKYPDIILHKEQHKVFIKKVVEVLEKLKQGKLEITESLLNFLQDWVTRHILDHDKKYGIYFSEINKDNK